jgi:RNA polymerase sigma factor (sigma-70 family)
MARLDRFDGDFDAVLDAARRGVPRAFETIFTALAPVVAGYLRVQGSREPDDLTSEVFEAVFRNLDRFEGGEAGFRSWVFTIAHRRLLDERRQLTRRPATEPLMDDTGFAAIDDVERDVEHALSLEHTRALCGRLAPNQRDVLLLRIVGRLTIDEVAAALGKTPGAVKALQRRGLQAISRFLEREGVTL